MIRTIAVAAIALTSVSYSLAAQSQEIKQGETVLSRERPELDPLGVRTGGFLFYPSVTAGFDFDDNIFATEDDEESDDIFTVRPEGIFESQWGLHELKFKANADFGRYSDNGDEDYEDYLIETKGRYDLARGNSVSGSLKFNGEHEDRSSPEDLRGEKPTEFSINALSGAYRHTFNRLSFSVGGLLQQFDYKDISTPIGDINNDDRDRDQNTATLEVKYDWKPGYDLLFRHAQNSRSYDDKFDDNGLERSSSGYKTVVGAEFDFTGVTFGEIAIGNQSQDYDDDRLPTIDGFVIDAGLTWNPSGLTTVQATVARDIRESIIPPASGYLQTVYGLQLDHELYRNILLHAKLSSEDNNYEGIERKEDVFDGGLGVTYMAHRNYYFFLGYDYTKRDSNEVDSDREFRRQILSLKVKGQL